MRRPSVLKPRAVPAVLVGLVLLSGCIKVRLVVKLNEDGSGQVVEEIVFGEKLVNASKRLTEGPTIDDLTSEKRVRERMAKMGEGVSLVSRDVEEQPDGSVRLLVVYAFEDISGLRLAPVPYGSGWKDVYLDFNLDAETSLSAWHHLQIRMMNDRAARGAKPAEPLLPEREAQLVRRLLPVFKDLLDGFELSLRLEIYRPEQWASRTKGHLNSRHMNPMSLSGGHLTIYRITDDHLRVSDDGLLMVIPWRQVAREFDLYHHGWPPGPRIMPYVNYIDGGRFRFSWRAIQTPHGREYY